jgi:transcriptional regulator of acetoin/glycerol metabolism
MAVFAQYPWPGNVRELENVIERALVLGSGLAIGLEDLPDRLTQHPALNAAANGGGRLIDVERDHIRRTLETVGGNKAAAARALDVNRKTLYRKLRQHRLSLS